MSNELRAKFIARLNAAPDPPLEATGKFLRRYYADDSDEEAQVNIAATVARNPRQVQEGLEGIEGLLANPPIEPGVLADFLGWEANRRLDDLSDEGAKEWLRRVAQTTRALLGDQPPLRRDHE